MVQFVKSLLCKQCGPHLGSLAPMWKSQVWSHVSVNQPREDKVRKLPGTPWRANVTMVRDPVSEDQGENQEEDKAISGLYK